MPSATARVRAPGWLVAGALAAALSLAGLSGCSDGGDAGAEATTTTRPATTTTDPKYGMTPAEVVRALAADDADLARGEERTIVAQGEPEYEQEPQTLGYCSYQLINEASRIQRLEVQLVDGDDVHATIDAALYTPGRAMSALRELRAGEMQCGTGPVPPLRWESETAPSTWSTKDLAASVTDDLTEDHWAKTVTRTIAGGEPQVTTVIAQRRGDAIVVVSSPDQDRALTLAASAGQRLAGTNSYLIEG
ncbi:MAG: hypothetical protein ACTHN0_08135 [Aquihabitans sp.]